MKLNIKNQDKLQSKINKFYSNAYSNIKTTSKSLLMAGVLGVFMITATGCSSSENDRRRQQQQKEEIKANTAYLQKAIETAKENNKSVVIFDNGAIQLVDAKTPDKRGEMIFTSPEIKEKFERVTANLEKLAKEEEEIVRSGGTLNSITNNVEGNQPEQITHNVSHSGGGFDTTDRLLWWMILSNNNNNNHNSMMARTSSRSNFNSRATSSFKTGAFSKGQNIRDKFSKNSTDFKKKVDSKFKSTKYGSSSKVSFRKSSSTSSAYKSSSFKSSSSKSGSCCG